MGEWIAYALVKFHRWLLLLAVVVAGLSIPMARQLNLDWQVEGMFAEGEPLVASYRRLQERFGGKDICLAVYRDPNLWDPSGAGLARLETISDRLAKVDGVQAVLSLAELHSILQKLRGPMQIFNLGPPKLPPLLDSEDKLAQAFAEVFEGYTHRRNSEYVAIACLLEPTAEDASLVRGPANHEATLRELQSELSNLPAPAKEGFVTGEPVLVAEGFRMVERDGWRLGIVSSFLVSLVLLVCFRSLRWTLIPLLVVHWSLVVTQAILVLLKLNLTMISSTLTAIVTVIGVATAMHLLLKFQEQRRQGLSRDDALRTAFTVLLAPIFWACVTDAVGFSALLISGVGPVRDFGLMMAIGSMTVFLAIAILVPGLALIGPWDTDPSTPKLDYALRLWLRKVLDACLARRTVGLALSCVLFLVGIVGSTRMEVETDFTKNFQPDSPIVQGYEIIERELGGAGVWDILLPAPAKIDGEYIAQVLELESQLRALSVAADDTTLALTKVLSIADAVDAAGSGTVLSALPVSARLAGMGAAMPEFTGALLTNTPDELGNRWLRVMLRSKEQAPASSKNLLVTAVRQKLAEFTSRDEWAQQFESTSAQGTPPTSEVAGYHVMLGKLVSSVLADQWNCFLLATLGIYVVMTIATRSLLLGITALLTNSLPILLVLGILSWMGSKANMGVAMIAAVSLGLSVDSSIHYLMHYRRRLAAGDRPLKSLRSAQENVGLAAVLATAALIAGFASLCTSEFVPTVVFGTLASLTMLGGLLGNLVLLPLLVAPGKKK